MQRELQVVWVLEAVAEQGRRWVKVLELWRNSGSGPEERQSDVVRGGIFWSAPEKKVAVVELKNQTTVLN